MDPARLLPSVTKMVLGVGEERQGPTESTGDPDVGCRQSLPWRPWVQAARADGG